jgi:hypothetical protein
MLFDLRSRGRRRTVQFVYLGLALLMGGGLVLFGVGAGNGNGGLLNAFTGNGSGNSQGSVLSSQEKSALKQVKADPSNASAWSNLVQARYENATSSSSDYNSNTGTFTAAGQKELTAATSDWQHYIKLTKNPDPDLATLVARAYAHLSNYTGAANAWSIVASASPNSAKGYECLAATSYAAKNTRQGALALNKALAMVPKLSRNQLKNEIQAAEKTPSIAQSC